MNRSQINKSANDVSTSDSIRSGRNGISMPAMPVLQQKSGKISFKEETGVHFESERSHGLTHSPLFNTNTPVQRVVKIAGVKYDEQRAFISYLQHELPRNGYTVPVKLLKVCAQAMRNEGQLHDTVFDTFEDFIDELVNLDLVSSRLKTTSVLERPKTLGKRPVFHSKIAVARNIIKEQKNGVTQAARHVIPSHLLGYAAEKVDAPVDKLKEWVQKHGNEGLPLKPTLNLRVQKRNIWIILHNHLGNLWIGDSLDNSVVGFISGGVQSTIRKMAISKAPLEVVKEMVNGTGTGQLGIAMANIKEAIAGAFAAIVDEYDPNTVPEELRPQATAEMIDALNEVWEQVEGDVPSFKLDEYELATNFINKFKEAPTLELFTEFMGTKFKGSSF